MKYIFLILIVFTHSVCFSQSKNKEILKIEIYAVYYDIPYYIPPHIKDIKEIGMYVCYSGDDIVDSNIKEELLFLEKNESQQIDTMEIEGNTRAFVTIHFEDNQKESLYILRGGIVWQNKRYQMYYPLARSVYYFLPARYFKKE